MSTSLLGDGEHATVGANISGGNVHADVQALISAGLLDVSKAGVRVEYDSIETKIAM
jgi:hypothetical protein